jgi:hypothetical protein
MAIIKREESRLQAVDMKFLRAILGEDRRGLETQTLGES